MKETVERDGKPLAESGLHSRQQRHHCRSQTGSADQWPPAHHPAGGKSNQFRFGLLNKLFNEPFPGGIPLPAARRGTAAVEVEDGQQTVLNASECAFDPQGDAVEQRPPPARQGDKD